MLPSGEAKEEIFDAVMDVFDLISQGKSALEDVQDLLPRQRIKYSDLATYFSKAEAPRHGNHMACGGVRKSQGTTNRPGL